MLLPTFKVIIEVDDQFIMKFHRNNISLRTLRTSDVPDAMRLKNAEGWNQTERDWKIFLEGGHNINLVAECAGEVIGTVTAINYENKVAWIGMMIVDSAYRGMGISRKLLGAVIEKLKDKGCVSIKLDATPAGRPVYKKLGFNESYTILRLVGKGVSVDLKERGTLTALIASGKDMGEIVALDRKIFGVERSCLIKALMHNYPGQAFVIKRGKRIEGFILGRRGTQYTQIGPGVAFDEKNDRNLIAKFLEILSAQPVVIDVPENKTGLINWLTSIGFGVQRTLYRMYLGENLYAGAPEYQFAICGPEFG